MDGSSGRRTPRPEERQRDAERTRGRIVDAAVAEFSDKGFAGARVGAIAARAGVNVQLISYYFGGKAGLYREINSRWQLRSEEFTQAATLADIAAGFARASARLRDWTRLLVWDGLTGSPDDEPDEPDQLAAAVEDLRRRQEAGEFPAELDPAHLLLTLFAAASAPVVLPQIARRITGADPTSAEFTEAYAEHLATLVRLLTVQT